MKLHLPKSLRTALLSCLAAISPWSLTLASGAISVGAVVFSLGAQVQAETISITSNTNWNATDDHSGDVTTVSGQNTTLQVGNGNSGALSANQTANLGTLTLEEAATLKLHAWTSTDRDISTDGKVKVAGAITLDNSKIWLEDGSYYFSDVLNVKGASSLTSQWNKGVVLDAISGDADAELTLNSYGRDTSGGALFVLGDGEAGNSSFRGTLVLKNNVTNQDAAKKTPTLVLNDATALQSAALKLGAYTNAIMQLERVSAGAVYGAGDILITFTNASNQTVIGHANPVLQITGNATEEQSFSGTMASDVTWQIGDGTKAASSRFDGATLNGALVIETGSTAYLTGDNTFGTLTNNGTLHLSEGSSFVITSAVYQGAVLTLGTVTGLSGNTFSYGNGWLATYDAATGTATITDNSSIYWIDNGVDGNTLWSSVENWQGGAVPTASDIVRLGSDGAGRIVSFDGDATVGEVHVVAGDYGFVASGNSTLTGTVHVTPVGATLTKSGAGILTLTNVTANALSVTEGELVVNTLSLANGDTFTKNGAGTLTLTNANANALSVTEGELVVNTLSLAHGSSFTKNGVGTMKLSNVSGILGKDVTVEAGELHITQTGDSDVANDAVYTVSVKAGAVLDDERRLRLTGGSLTVTGGGIYELEGICLSGTGQRNTELNVEASTVLRITGSSLDPAGTAGSFMVSHWNANNTVNIRGLLVSDVGISDRDGRCVINVENGGALQLNDGMTHTNHGREDTTLNVKSGGALIVNSSKTDYTGFILTALSDGSTVFTTSGATIANNMTYAGTVKLGAAADKELSLTATAEAPSFTNLTIMGSADKVSALDARTVKEYAAGGTVKFTNALSGTSITLNAGAQFEATAGLTLTGALTLGANAEATLGGAVSIASLAGKNAGTLTFAGSLTSLALQDFNFGQEYEIGTVTNGNNVDWCALLNYSNTLHTITYENGVLISSYKEVLWSSPADNDITWGGADNWSVGGSSIALSGTENVVLGVIDTTVEQPVSSVIQIAANTTVAGVTVRDDYSLSVAEGAEFSFDSTTITFEEGGSLSKVGQGTLSMNVADATAAKMNIAVGTLRISDTLASAPLNTVTQVDLSSITSTDKGVLSVTLGGAPASPGASVNNGNKGPTVSALNLGSGFVGTLEVLGGKLSITKSNLGSVSHLALDNAGILVSTSGSAFGAQEFDYHVHVGKGGAWIDHYGGSTYVKDNWSSKHTGALTGSGVLTFIGMGEWVLAGDYSAFTGGLALGSESQYLYVSSDMENLKSLDWNNAQPHDINKASVVVGYDNTAGVKMTVAEKQTVSYNGSAIKLTNGSTFTHTGGVTVADNTTFNVISYDANSSGIYNTANVEFATANSKLAVAGKVVANITGTAAYTATCGTIDIASGATVNDNRALTIDGAYNITGAGTYNQLGTLALTENGVLTLSGKVSINSLAGNNAGVLTFADLSSLELKDFVIGEAYEIGTVTDGANVDWQSLMGYTDRRYSIEYDNGMLNSVFNDIVWSSPVDDDITWGGSDNWVMGGESVAVEATDSVLLGTIGDSGVSPTIQLAANTTVAGVTVQDAYSLSVAEGETYSFDAGSIVLDGGSLSKTGAGTLSMSSEDAVAAQMHIAGGTLSLSDALVDYESGSRADLTALSGSGTLSITAAGDSGVTGDGTGQRTSVILADSFTGTLAVVGGNLDMASSIGRVGSVLLDGATLVGTGSDVQELGWNIAVSDKGAYLRRFGYERQDNRTSYATRLTGTLTGSAAAMLRVIDSGEWFMAGDMSGYHGGLSIEGNTNYVTFESSATLASLSAVGGSRVFVDNGATLTAPALAVNGTIYTGATEGSTFNMGAVTIANKGTLDVSGTGSHVIDSLDMTAATTALTLGEQANLTVGTWVTEQDGDTETVSISLGAGAELAYTSTRERKHINQTVSVTLGAESTIKDAGVMKMSGGKLTVSGNGVYELAGLQLSGAGQGITTALEVGAGSTLHITGTTNNDRDEAGAFFTHNWVVAQNSPNTISVSGVLALECGISSAEGYGVITVNSGGKLAFNRGLTADSRYGNRDTINIKGGGVLEVSGTDVTGTNLVTVNVNQNGIVMGGNANGATESKIANNMVFVTDGATSGAYIGAKAGTTLTLAPESGSMELKWMDIIGTGDSDAQGKAQGAGGTVVFDADVTVLLSLKVLSGSEAVFRDTLSVTGTDTNNGLHNFGKLTVDGAFSGKSFDNAAGAEATFNSGISLMESAGTTAVVDNSGNLTVTGTTAMSRFNNKTGAEATFNSGLSLFESAGTAAVVDNSGKLTVNGTLSMYHFNNNAGAEAEINGDVMSSNGNYALIYNSGKVSFNANVEEMHQIRNSEGGEMVFTGEMNGSVDALQNAGKLVFDGATVRLGNAILNGGSVEILNAADTQFVLSNGLMQEIVGVSKTWTLVNNTGEGGLTGTITGWNELGLENFLLDGSALQQGDWDGVRITDGKVMLYMLTRYWDATGDEGVWNTGADANWREFEDSTKTVTFEANSRVTFTDTDETGKTALAKRVTVADAGVQAKNVGIAGTGYVFSGGKVLVNESLSALQNARFDSAVVIGSAAPLQLDVAAGATLTLSTLETVSTQSYGGVSYGSGAFRKTGAGTLLITEAINGTITGATVSGGKLVLGVAGAEDVAKTVSLAVGSNTLTTAGGSLENVELLSSGTVTDYTGATAQANNVIKSADGVNYAMLTDVELRAGAATGYASLQKVAFAGNSTLSGYITYESTKQQRQMAVATNGTLTVSNLTFDLHGLSAGTKVLIENGAVADAAEGFKGTLEGWNSENVTLLYSGIAVNSAAVNMGTAGVVALDTAENNTAANMYWDGLVAGAAESDAPVASSAWDKSSANWSDEEGKDGRVAFLALSNTYFGATPEGGSKKVNAAQDMVMSNMFVTEGGYSFTGSRLATLGNMHITPKSGTVSFTNELVAQGNVELRAEQDGSVTLGGALQAGGTITATGEGDLSFNSTVQSGGDITLTGNGVVTLAGNVSTAGKFSIGTEGAAVMDKADASTLYTIAGTLTAKDILINMDASTLTAAADTGDHLVVSGNVSAMGDSATPAEDGTITLLGSAAKKFTGFVTADTLRVNAAHGTLNNVITFTNVVDVNTLEIAEDTYVRIVHADSDMDTVLLGGTLYMDTVCVTYDNGYDIYSTSDAAELVFGTISSNTINLISGLTPAEAADDVADAGQYNSISVNANTRFLTVNALADLKDLTLYNGPMTVKAGEGAIHGNLVVRDAAGLTLTQNANNIMAEGSGSITVDHANMNLNSTTQTLRSGNDLYLAGGAITGNANGVGLNFVGSSSIHYTGNSTVSANMTVAEGSALTVQAGKQMEDTLTLSGSISGAGNITMQGDGRVLLSGANTAYTGAVTVQQQTGLKLGHVDALAGATLNLAADGTLLVDRAAVGAPFNIGKLNTIANAPVTLAEGTTLTAGTIQIHSLQAMDTTSAADAAFNVGTLLVSADQVLNLTLSFAEGESLQTMKTYNLFTSAKSLADVFADLNVELYIAANNISNHVASSQYKLVYDATANVIAIRTMLGNIWDGGADGDGIWSLANTDKNWTGKDYDESSAYNDAIFADLTGEGIGESAVVTIQGTVNPGDVYFESGTTVYELNATEGGAMLAAGTVIHKAGKADVTLNLANNGTAANALGGMELQAGATKLAADLAVAGEVSVAAGATLQTGGNQLLMVAGDAAAYTAQGTYSGLTLDAAGIAGVSGTPGTVTNGIINGAAELSNLNLTGTGTLSAVTIGSGVTVATNATYTLSGLVAFNDTLQNNGTVNFAEGVTVELGGLSSTLSQDGTSYIYQLVQGDGTINGLASGITEQDSGITASDVFINGVNLSAGLADGIATVLSSDKGTVSISIGKKLQDGGGVDGSIAVTSWDARWGEVSGQPSLAKRYTGDYNGAYYFAEGADSEYAYNKVVNAANADKVNGGKAIVVYLSAEAFGAGGSELAAPVHGEAFAGHETWVYDSSDVYQVVAGQHFSTEQAGFTQNADTHLYVDANNTQEKAWVVGGSWNVAQRADSYVTVENGKITGLVGAGVFAAAQFGTAHVYVDGGTVTNIYGAGFENGAHLTANTDKNANAVEMQLTGGTITNVYGGAGYYDGADTPTVTGNIAVTVKGNATITTLYGGSMNGGEVTGNINLDLISGSITTVHAAGASGSTLAGNVTVTLHNDDVVTGALYGGKQTTNKVDGNYTSTLYLAEAGEYVFAQWKGDAAGTHDGLNQVLVAGSAVTIAGFDVVSLAQGAVLTVDTNHFDRDITNGTLVITGNGIVQMGGKAGARRDIRLENGAIFKLLSSYTAENFGDEYDGYSELYVTDGTTFDISGYPRENAANDGGGSIAYHVYLSGDGVDGIGALYKGTTDKNNSTNPSGKAALGYIELTGNASATAEHNIAMIGPNNATTYLDLNGYTFTKRGEGAYVLRNTVINGGTYYGHEGTVQPEQTSTGADADLVLAAAATLKLNDECNFTMRCLTGAGDTDLGAFKLTLAPVSGGKYYAEFMDETNSYDNLMSGTGFAYGVYSGKITGGGSLYIGNKTDADLGDRTGVQYLSGTDSTYSGGTHVEAGRLYLLSSTQGSISKGGSEVTSGPIGTGALYWDSTKAEVYLGHGVTVYNAGGTNAAGSDLILGVEGAPDGDLLKNYPGVNGTVVKDGVTYHEVDTHNLQSISCDGVYADGTAYVAGTEIDRNKMLLVTEAAWNSESSTVKGFTDTGYNEATYSGVLSGEASLVKVGAGTLVIDQANAYTGGTDIQGGTLKLKGWAQIGSAADGTIDVTQTDGTSLMLAYDGTYGDELSSISNNMVLTGTGDQRWDGSEETGGVTAALISDVGSGVTFTLSGDISGKGNLLHSGEGTLVLSGDSSFSGGMHATRGVVEVQSATGLGAGAVKIDSTADLHVTVEDGTTASRVATTLAAAGTTVQGDVVISGTESTERILNVATDGYNNSSTTLHDNGTLLVNGKGVNGEGVSAKTALLTGSGTVAVSDATGSGASATVGQMTAYTGDFVVEGNKASITVENGSYSGGSISVSGNDAVLSTKGDITITNGESLSLSSRGNAGAENDAAYVTTTGSVSVAGGATLSVSDAATSYDYNLQNLQAAASLNGVHDLVSGATTQTLVDIANIQNTEHVYKGAFDTTVAMNQKAAGAVKADGGLTLAAGATYETAMANTSLLGGSLTLESGLTLSTTLDLGQGAIDGAGRTTQLVLFSDVSGVNFVLDNLNAVADADGGIYYTKAENYITGNYIDEDTWLVYDSGAGVVYLDGIVPEPTTATLSLLALAALAARRRRR